MKKLIAILLLSLFGGATFAEDLVYEGTWNTVRNLKLDGTMKCLVQSLGKEKWKGTFSGVWQGQPFSYTVDFTGPPDKLQGKARIDGAFYRWTGKISNFSPGRFTGTFTGTRYDGSFDLKSVKSRASPPKK